MITKLNTNQEFRCFYDWRCTLQITINGQLLLLKNVEMQTSNPLIEEDMCNTDGVTYYFPESELEYFNKTNKEWEILSKTELEKVNYELVVKSGINTYLAYYYDKKGNVKIKEKGAYNAHPNIDASKSFLIIAIIIQKYFLQKYFYNNEIDIEYEVKNHPNIYDFCSSAKINRDYEVIYNGEKVQHLNRYYVSNNGSYLYKTKKAINSKNGKNTMSAVLKDTKITLQNRTSNVIQEPINNPYDIDYNYYINKIKEEILEFNIETNIVSNNVNQQLKLF